MSDEEKSERSEPNQSSYPLKYWWVVLVALPIALGLLKVVPDVWSKKSGGGGTTITQRDGGTVVTGTGNILGSDLSTKNYVINLATIEKEYVAAKNEPLTEEIKAEIASAIALLEQGRAVESAAAFEKVNEKVSLPALQTDLGVAYQKAGQNAEAAKAFFTALGQNSDYAAAHHNLALVKASEGELSEARGHFEQAGAVGESRELVSAIDSAMKDNTHEVEPNNAAAKANALPLEKAVDGNISTNKDSDFFRLKTPPKYRDILRIRIENQTTTLQPGLSVFDANKAGSSSTHDDTAGANLEHSFVVEPDATFFLQVYGRYGSQGRYRITAKPLKRFDAFEPNNTILEPAALELGKATAANIMDGGDTDFYRLKTGSGGETVKVHIENRSQTLQPGIRAFDGNKSALTGTHDDTAGANLDFSFAAKSGEVYHLQIYGRYRSVGDYALTATQE